MRRKDKRVYWLWLSHACGQGSACAVELVRNFGDAEAVFDADADELDSCGVKIEKRTMSKLCLKDTEEDEEILEWCDNLGVRVLYPGSDGYPKGLLSLRDAPMVLYCIGDLPDFDKTFSCAVVGTRSMSAYGRDVSYALGAGLVDCGACVISGLALGIDGMAMAGAVEAGGACVAVLGCGVDTAYPKAHEKLLQSVLERGAVISEYAPGTSPLASHFPVRNRIISGLSQAVCVVEGQMNSGSLITARHAVFQGKAVYAVPGRVGDCGAQAPNYLLTQGAQPATCAADIIKEYEYLYPHTLHLKRPFSHISPTDAAIKLGVCAKNAENGRAVAVDMSYAGAGTAGSGDAETVVKDTDIAKAPAGEKKAARPAAKKKDGEKKTKNAKIGRIKKADAAPFPKEEEKRPFADVSTLRDADMTVFENMIPDTPVLADELSQKCAMKISDVMVSLTMLEMCGLIEAGAGGYFIRRGADTMPDSIGEEDDGL